MHTKNPTPGMKQSIGSLHKRDFVKTREALSRVVKTISIKRRMTIIRKINEIIGNISDYDDSISFKKIVKILNLC